MGSVINDLNNSLATIHTQRVQVEELSRQIVSLENTITLKSTQVQDLEKQVEELKNVNTPVQVREDNSEWKRLVEKLEIMLKGAPIVELLRRLLLGCLLSLAVEPLLCF